MAQGNFVIRLLAELEKARSEKQIKQDIKSFGDIYVKLIASLQKGKSKKQIKTDAKSLGDMQVKLTGSLDMPKTRKQIKNQLKGVNGNFSVTPKVNQKAMQNAVKQVQKQVNANKLVYNFDLDKKKFQNQLKVFAKDNSKLFTSKEMTAKYNQLVDSAGIAKSKTELKELRGQLSAFRAELLATNKAGMTWTDKFKSSISHFAQYFSGASFIYAVTNQLRNAWTEAKTLDDRLVDLQKVTAEIESRDSLYKYFDKALNKANELNVKVDSLIYAITEFKKLGWSLSDAELGGEWATKLSNVGDIDIDTAIGSIKTSIASFDEIGGYTDAQMSKKIEAYADLINNMSNKYSIDAEGLAEAIRLSAGTLTEADTSIEQAATMYATANKYYNDPSYLGNTAKIGSLRLRASEGDDDAIKELSEMGEEVDELAGATSKLRDELKALTGVDIMKDDNTFKSYYDQLYEISQVIDSLEDTSAALVLEKLFGKNRAAAGRALLSGLQESDKAYEDAVNSAGSATIEYEKWMQSADAATQRFSNSLTEMYQSIMNGNTVRDIANLGSAVLDFANQWGIVEGAVRGFLALKIGTFLTNGTMAFLTATKQVEQYGKALQLANNIPNGNLATRYNTLKSIAVATNTLTTAQLKNVLSGQSLTQQDRIRILQMQGLTKEMALQKLAEMGLTQATNAQTAANAASTASTFSLKSAMMGLGATIKSVFLSNPIGIALMAISLAISGITSAISNHNQKMEEMRDKAKEAASEANTLGDEIASLSSKYIALSEAVKTDASAKEDLISTQAELLEKLGLEGESIDDLIAKYGSLSNAIRQASIDSLKNSQLDLIAGVNAAKDELLDIGADGFWGGNNIINATGDDAVKGFKELEKAGVVDSGSYGSGGGALVLIGDDTTTEGILENYQKLEDALNALRDSNAFTAEELTDNSLYQAIYGRYNEMKEKVDAYKTSIGDLNENLAQQTMLTALQGSELPKSEQEFEKFKQELSDTAIASKQFIGTEKEITDSINNYLSKVPEFAEYFSVPLEKEVNRANSLSLDGVVKTLATLQDKYNELKSAQEEYNSTGAISAETMQKLIDNDLLQYLDYSSGKLKINTDALLAEGEAAKVNAIQKLQDAMATDLMNLATGKTDQLSNTAKTAIANLGNSAETTGNQAQTAASKLAGFAIAAQAAKDGAEGNLTGMSVEDFNTQANAIISAYTSAANSIGGITIKSPKTSKGSSSSSKNNALDKHLKDAERRYKIHQDETKYIEELDYALNKLVKTDEERLEILDKIEDARKDYADNRIKDLEHEKEMLKNMYGDNYDTSYIDRSIQQIHHEEAERLRALGYDDNSDEIQEHQSGWWDKQNELLDNMSLQYENRIKDIEHARDMFLEQNPLGDTTSFYKQLQEEYHKEAERLRALDPEKYKEEIQELQLLWHDAQNEIADWSLSNSERWINERNLYGDWDKFADNEVAAWKRVLDRFRKEHANELDKIKEIEEKYFNAIKNELIDSLNFNSSQIGSLHTLLQSYYDVTNSITEAQHEINKELDASLTMYEYLDEETRKLLFNQEDYNILSEKLLDLQYEADKLQRQYNRDVLNATEENLEEITAQYEMQYETMLKKYEIARAELNVAKKRQQLDNVLNERNVRMLIDGQWQWVANTQDVLNAKAELADAEYAAQVAKHTLDQTKSLNNLTSAQNVLTTTINNVESGVIAFNSNLGDITKGLGEIVTNDIPALKSIINDVGSAIKNYNSNVNNKDTTYNGNTSSGTSSKGGSSGVGSSSAPQNNATATIPGIGEVGIHINDSGKTTTTGLPVGTVVHTGGGDYKITGGTGGNYSSIKVKNKYADGTNYTKPGSALMGEDGKEIYIDNNGHYIPIEQPTLLSDVKAGGIVFNQDQMKSLHTLWDMSNFVKMPDYSSLVNRYDSHNMTTNNDYSVTIKDLVVDNGVNGQELVNALRRYVAIH